MSFVFELGRTVQRGRRSWTALWLALGIAVLPAQALAQGALSGDEGGEDDGDAPIEIFADNGIEWRKDVQMYIARGNAVAVDGDELYYGDVLIAHYRDKGTGPAQPVQGGVTGVQNPTAGAEAAAPADSGGSGGGTEIYRMEARGNVIIVQPDRITSGDLAVRDIDRKVMWVTGNDLRMETPQDVVLAEDSLEYWADLDIAVARGQAVNYKPTEDRTIRGDVLTAYFSEPEGFGDVMQVGSVLAAAPETDENGAEGGTGDGVSDEGGIRFMTAHGNVVVVTPEEVVYGDEGTYDPQTAIAVVLGDVRVTTSTDQMNGTRAVINTRTGVRTLEGGRGTRARALLKSSEAGGTADDADGTTADGAASGTGAGAEAAPGDASSGPSRLSIYQSPDPQSQNGAADTSVAPPPPPQLLRGGARDTTPGVWEQVQ